MRGGLRRMLLLLVTGIRGTHGISCYVSAKLSTHPLVCRLSQDLDDGILTGRLIGIRARFFVVCDIRHQGLRVQIVSSRRGDRFEQSTAWLTLIQPTASLSFPFIAALSASFSFPLMSTCSVPSGAAFRHTELVCIVRSPARGC